MLHGDDGQKFKANVMVLMTKTKSGKKSEKCNQCDYVSFGAGDLRRHLKIHSGEKSEKCNQCDYAIFRQNS